MVSKKDLQEMNMSSIEEYFELIIELLRDGSADDIASKYYNDLTKRQRGDFMDWYELSEHHVDNLQERIE